MHKADSREVVESWITGVSFFPPSTYVGVILARA